MASSSSSSTADFPASFYCSPNSMSVQVHPRKYLVFINFRGKDTREGFVSILYEKLEQRGILAYLDSVELDKGAEIKTIIGAIQESNIAVVVFSNEYATSPYCLHELVKIMDCRENTGLQVLVVFYRVTPENVENLEDEEDLENPNKSFAKAFVTHKKSCDEETIVKWKTALKKATSVGGWDKASKDIRNEADLANKIVEDILEKRMHIYFRVDLKGLVGMRRRVEDIESLLFGEKVNDVRIVGIWGMGGIGKTTLARAIFDKYSFHFQSGCFLENVRAASNNLGLLRELKDELLAGLLNRANKSIRTSSSSSNFSMDQLRHKKVLIVLDDVDKFDQIEYLAGKRECFGEGSRVIITSRNRQVLKNGVDVQYEVKQLDDGPSLELFSLHAFKQSYPPADRVKSSNIVVKYARGLPLALKILGLFLHDRSDEEWGSALVELQNTLNKEIEEVLKISYDGLDRSAKEIFLHIACFFRGEPKADVERILDSCGFFTIIGLSKLADKALIIISNSIVEMHNLLQKMGQEIVIQESIKEPGKRSRLWNPKDIGNILENKETGAIEGISLDLAKLRKSVCMSPTVFSKMDQLKLLRFRCGDKLNFPRGLESLPRELRYLRWDHYPLEALPSKVYFENLVELDMRHGKIERFWTRKQNLSGLRVMRVHWVFSLIEMPDFSGALNLQIIDFQDCSNLLEISSSIKYLKNLKELNVTHCTKIKSVPSTKGLPSLGKLILRDCSALENLSEVSENIEELDLCGTGIKEVPSCSQLTSLRKLNLLKCRNLQKFPEISTSVEELSMGESKIILEPHMIRGLSRIQTLRLTGQKVLGKTRNVLGRLSSLRDLDLSSGNFKFIPASIKNLSCLQFLGLHRCRRLQLLPELPPHLIRLNAAGCKSLEVVKHSRFEIVGTLERLPDFRVNFSFFACGKLNEKARRNVLIHAQQRIRLLAREPLYQLSKGVGRKDEVRFVYPGSEIPDWIDLQSNGNSITVELPPNLLDGHNFLGFVISAVVVFPISRVFVQCHFESISAARNLNLDVEMLASSDPFPSTHVALCYSSSLHQAIVSSFKEEDYYKKATFCFSESIIGGRIFGVTNCGVRLLRIGDGEE